MNHETHERHENVETRKKDKPGRLDWIPWRRYVLVLHIDGVQKVFLGRFRLKKSCEREAERLSVYAGYEPIVIDTKEAGVE